MKKLLFVGGLSFVLLSIVLPVFAEETMMNNPDTCICTMEYNPVCGKDGITYGNACGMSCNNIELDHVGACEETVMPEPMMPHTCTSRYDGCNTCMAENGATLACTKMMCIQHDTPKCLEHTFVYITKRHEFLIHTVLKNYFGSMSSNEKQMKTSQILKKIVTKREAIMDILSRSTFIIGSPELRNYYIQLEVIDFLNTELQ